MRIWNDEYEKDGMIYCKKCGGERLFIWNGKKIRCACRCQNEEYERRSKKIEIDVSDFSILGERRFSEARFSNTKTGANPLFDTALSRCSNYCEHAEEAIKNGYGIYMYGERGTGKSRLAACMAHRLCGEYSVLFTNFSKIKQAIIANKSEFSDTTKLSCVDFLLIDDIGAQRVQTENGDTWLQEKMFDIIDRRYSNKKPTVFTSNFTMQELVSEARIAPRTVDRIMGMSSAIIKIAGASYRREERKTPIPF